MVSKTRGLILPQYPKIVYRCSCITEPLTTTLPTIHFVFQEDFWNMSIGVPIKVLHEAEGHIVTCETNTGEVYRGKLIEAEDNMNCQVGTK